MYEKYLKIVDTKEKGRGVFTSVTIPAQTPVFEFSGDLLTEETMPDPNHPALLQVGNNVFIGPSGNVDDYINHSCDPNCYLHIVGNRAIIYSLYVIPADSELTFDYSTSSTDTIDKWNIECKCGSKKCRSIISGLQYVDDEIKKEYQEKQMIPMFLNNKMFER